jgi:cephalosporin-C deacetylase-like acetyl esterase
MPGLDVQDVLAAVDYFVSRTDVDSQRIGIVGIGQGGMTALHAAAVDRRISAAAIVDYLQVRDWCWKEPVDRRLSRRLLEFGDAELAALIAPRPLWCVHTPDSSIAEESIKSEILRAERICGGREAFGRRVFVTIREGDDKMARSVLPLADHFKLPDRRDTVARPELDVTAEQSTEIRNRHFEERLKYLRNLIANSEAEREAKWKLACASPADFEQIKAKMLDDYRRLVGHVPTDGIPLNPKTTLALSTEKYKLYRITLDVTQGVEVYGNLLVPRDIEGQTAAVICQHGLSGTPEMTTGLGITTDTAYHEFARHLAEQGYVVFSPYLMQRQTTEINELALQADAVGMMRVAMPVAKTRRIVDFLGSLSYVDPRRIGYYGLSYGGYSAIWISPLEPRLAATVISGHFNDWRSKITDDSLKTSYLWHPDEDFYNWNILHRFTHPELIAMIAPRPVCVEFGERDGITTPDWTAYAWKQVVAWRDHLGFADRIVLDHFDGVHEIHAVGAVDFLDRFLRPSRTVGRGQENRTIVPAVAGQASGKPAGSAPFVTHILDSRGESKVSGEFWIPAGAKELRGMAIKLSRNSEPSALEVRFGSRPGMDDIGTAELDSRDVGTDQVAWYELRITPHPLRAGILVYYDITCASSRRQEGQFIIYGPRPIGGKDLPNRFALSYQVLTDRPQDRFCRTRQSR